MNTLIRSWLAKAGLALLTAGLAQFCLAQATQESKPAPAKPPAAAPAAPAAKPATPAKPAANGAAKADAKAATDSAKAGELMDINTASEKELATLPKIGEARAKAIVKGRPYKRKDELLNKKIIPSDAYEAIKDQVIAKQK